MKRIALLFAAGLCSQAALCAENVVGYIDLQQLAPTINKMQQQSMKVDDASKREYETMQKHVADLKTKASTDQSKMTAAQKEAFNKELSTMKQQLTKESMAVSGKMMKSQQDAMRQVQDSILKQVADIAKQRHVTTVFPKQVLLYSEGTVDLTPDLIKKLDHK